MHAALYTYDSLLLILQSCGRSDQSRMGRTCTLLLAAAMDLVWSDIQHTEVLIRLITKDAWAEQSPHNLSLVRDVHHHDCTRFLLYAAHVKQLTVTPKDYRLLRQVARGLHITDDFTGIFPKVARIQLSLGQSDTIPLRDGFQFFVAMATVKSIDIKVEISRAAFAKQTTGVLRAVCDVLSVKAGNRNLNSLRLSFSGSSFPKFVEFCDHHLATAIVTSKGLRRLLVQFPRDLTQGLIEVISHLEVLEDLTLRALPDTVSLSATADRFPSLKRLDITGDLSTSCAVIQCCVAPEALEYLRLAIVEADHNRDPLQTLGRCTGLLEMNLDLGALAVEWNDLRPTLASTRVEKVTLIFDRAPLDLTDSMLSELAGAWPGIRELEIQNFSLMQQDPPKATLWGLQCFTIHCPHLSKLAITVDARRFASKDDDGSPRLVTPHPCLVAVDLGISVTEDVNHITGVARTIDTLWPKLKLGFTRWDEHRHESHRWRREEDLWNSVWNFVWERKDARSSLESSHQQEVRRLQEQITELRAQLAAFGTN